MLTTFLPAVITLPPWSGGLAVLLAKATIILVAALAITRQMHRASAGARHLVWLVTLGTLLFVPVLTAWAPIAIRILPARAIHTAGAPSEITATPQRTGQAAARVSRVATMTAATASVPAPAATPDRIHALINSISPAWPMWLGLFIWGTIALGITATLAWSTLAVRRIVRHASPLDDAAWRTPLLEVSDRLGLDTPPRLLVSHDIKMPFACGVITPAIVLPAECNGWSLDRRQSVLLHELAHVRRGDLLGHMLGRLVCAAYWFHPLVWTAAKHLRSESERACDDLALACGTRATDYAEHLLDIVTSVRTTATPTVALAMARRKEFEGRLLAILDPDLRHSTPSRRQSAALITALALSASLVAAAAPMPRVIATHAAPVTSAVPATANHQPQTYDQSSPVSGAQDRAVATTPHPVVQAIPAPRTAAPRPTPLAPVAAKAERADLPSVSPNAGATATSGEGALTEALSGARQHAPDDRAALLAKVLRTDSSAHLRRIAAWGLQEFTESSVATDALVNAVAHDADAHVREMSAWALSNYDRAPAVSAVLGAAAQHDASVDVRATAVWALGNRGASGSADALVAALTDSSPRVRERAAWALGNVDMKQAPPALIAMLRDSDEECRRTAAWALHEIEDPAALPALEAALRAATDEDSQITYLRAIAAMGDRSVDVIRNLLDSSNPRIKTMAVRVLAGGEATGPWPQPRPEPRPFP